PAKSEAVIFRDVFKKGDAWFNTGDLMRDIGCKHAQFVDRLGDTFRWHGENVSTTEVENVLGAWPGVEDAVVYGVEVPGADGRCGGAALPRPAGAAFAPVGLAADLRPHLPPDAVPRFVRLLDDVDTTGAVTYRKTGLKRQAAQPLQASDPLDLRLPDAEGLQA